MKDIIIGIGSTLVCIASAVIMVIALYVIVG